MSCKPRRCTLLDKMRAGKKTLGFKINFDGSRGVEMAAMSGFDSIWLCYEHVPMNLETMEKGILAAKAHDTDCIVRVSKGCYSDLIHPLEADASGIMVPHVMSAAEARDIVHWTRFYPIGRRPIDGGNADGLFCKFPVKEYMQFANENRIVMIQIEDPEPMAELDEICQVPGIDMIFFGPADYSHSMGVSGELASTEVQKARKLIVDTAHKYGKFAGTTTSMATMAEYYEMGYDFLNCGSDVSAMLSFCGQVMDTFNALNLN